jgi:cation efflux system membrane fusion protein
LLGIQVNPIEPATGGSSAVLIPVTALVDDNGRQLVFVQYENFYEPIDVVTGETQGDLIEVLEGVSIGEQLVTQGSLSLYAESRKTITAEATDETTAEIDSPTVPTEETHAQLDAEGVPHSHDASGNLVESNPAETAVTSVEAHAQAHAEGSPHSHGGGIFSKKWLLGAIGGGIALTGGAIVLIGGGKKNPSGSEEACFGKEGGF